MEFSTEEDFDIFEFKGKEFSITLNVEFHREPAQYGGKTDPSWEAFHEIDTHEILSILEWDDEREIEVPVCPKEVILEGKRFVSLQDEIAEAFIEKHTEKMIELYEDSLEPY